MADFSSTMRDKIVALYGTDILHKSVISIRGGAGVLTELLQGGKYKTVLEIGTYRGVGAAEISQYVERVITIDLKHGKLERLGEKHDRAAFWKSLGIDNIEFIGIEDDAEKERVVNALDFDFALIDGAHDPTVANDFELVKRCGNVLFHDFDRRGKREQDYVIDFIETLPKHQLTPMDIFAMWRNG
jgi:predicted O-methyltransferase YrrM